MLASFNVDILANVLSCLVNCNTYLTSFMNGLLALEG